MKGIRVVFLLFFVVLVSISSVKGGNPPPPDISSAKSSNAVADDDCPCIPAPPEDELPINNNLVFLLVTALALGTVVVYKNKIKKASI